MDERNSIEDESPRSQRLDVHRLAQDIASFRPCSAGTGSVPFWGRAARRLDGVIAKFMKCLPGGASDKIRIQVTREPERATDVGRHNLAALAAFIDALADALVGYDYALCEGLSRRRLVKALNGLNDTALSGAGVTIRATASYPRRRRESVVG